MNVPRTIETAMAAVLREHAEIGENVVIRAFQSLASDGSWNINKDRKFPCLDIRCSPPSIMDGQCQSYAECHILCATKIDDDKDHETLSALYEETQACADRLFSQFRKRTDGAELSQLKADLAADLGTDFEFSALIYGEPIAPSMSETGINTIGIRLRVVFIRKDFI